LRSVAYLVDRPRFSTETRHPTSVSVTNLFVLRQASLT